MKLLEKFSKEFEPVNTGALKPLLQAVDVCDITVENPTEFNPKSTIYLGHKSSPEELVDLVVNHNIEHFVQLDREGYVFDLLASAIMIQKPAAFIKNPLAFFINHFKPQADADKAVRSTTLSLSTSLEKGPILHSINTFIEDHPKTANFKESVQMIADELLMNALFNAPTYEDGSPIHMNTDRSGYVELPANKKAKLFITHDHRRLLIGCEDPFGSVNRFKLVQQLNKVFRPGQMSEASTATAGAGLGCKMMIENSCGFYMVVKKGVRTLVCCSLPLGMSYVKATTMSKNLHMVFF